GVNALFVRWDDLSDEGSIDAELATALAALGDARTTYVVLGPGGDPARDDQLELRLAPHRHLEVISDRLVQQLYPVAEPYDAVALRYGHVPYTERYFAAMGSTLMRRCLVGWLPPRKVVVADCDHTLWRGVVGEDGPRGVEIEGSHRFLQARLAEQADGGRVIAVASKNREADVFSVWGAQGDHMPLRREHIVAHRINWRPKPDNLRELATELSLDLDSFVFIDDNPVECAAMRSALPQVVTIEFNGDDEKRLAALNGCWALDARAATAEDRKRALTYRTNVERRRLARRTDDFGEFLARLNLKVDIAEASLDEIPRAAQLTQRTNQFNATTKRTTEADARRFLRRDDTRMRVTRLSDRFGDYGWVGLVSAEANAGALVVVNFLLSCRALGRGVEHRMLADLGRCAEEMRCDRVRIPFVPTARNEPMQRFLSAVLGQYWCDADGVYDAPASSLVTTRFEPAASDLEAAQGPGAPGQAAPPSASASALADAFAATATELCDLSSVLRALRARVRRRPDVGGWVRPKAGLERQIADIWQEVLRVDRVGAEDRFNDLGGASIHLVQVHGRLLARLGLDVPITTLFQHPTVSGLARALGRGPRSRLDGVRERTDRRRAAFAVARRRHDGARQGARTEPKRP
ncbi:MAG: HAD-IIIC family phosphatase, partial [Myxococcota bacterium]